MENTRTESDDLWTKLRSKPRNSPASRQNSGTDLESAPLICSVWTMLSRPFLFYVLLYCGWCCLSILVGSRISKSRLKGVLLEWREARSSVLCLCMCFIPIFWGVAGFSDLEGGGDRSLPIKFRGGQKWLLLLVVMFFDC